MSELAGVLVPQILLCIITLFIYYPAAIIKVCRYIIEGTYFCDDNGVDKGGYGFEGQTGRGWALMWGQMLLTIITLGIYAPWAMAKIGNWWLNKTWVDDRV